jgi:TP901 family phage tail tape measure protein
MANKKVTYTIDVDTRSGVVNVQKLDTSIAKLESTAPKSSFAMDSLFSKTTIFASAAGAALLSVANKAEEMGSRYQTAVNNLSAITGIAGERLQGLSNTALVESARTGIAADQIVEAYKLVASQLAEKIDFGTDTGIKQLKGVANEALILARASGIDLKTAVEATASTINQFGKEASDASEIVNNLAAGAKFGAAEVADIAASFAEAGTSAALAGQSISVTNAAVQVLAQNTIKGAQAGTGLRNVFTILQTSADKLANYGITNLDLKTNGLASSLEQLQPILSDATAMEDIFGRENLNVAQILIKNASSVESMTQKLEGTLTAYEQAATQTATYQVALDKLSNALTSRLIQAFNAVEAPISKMLNSVSDLIAPSDALSESYISQQTSLNTLVATIQTAGTEENIRLSAIQKIKAEYPDFLRGIDLEKASNEQLSKALKEVNNDYVAKIALSQMDEKIQVAAAQKASLLNDQFTKQQEVIALINRAQNEYGVSINANGTLAEKYAQAQEGLSKKSNGLGIALNPTLQLAKSLQIEFNNLTSKAGGLNTEVDNQSKLLTELNQRKADLKKTLVEQGLLTDETTTKTENSTEATRKQKEELDKLTAQTYKVEIETYQKNVTEIESTSKTSVEDSIDAEILAQNLEIQKALEKEYSDYIKTEFERRGQIASKSYQDEQAFILDRINLLAQNDETAKLQSISDIRAQMQIEQEGFNQATTDQERVAHLEKLNQLDIELFAKLNGISVTEARESEAHQKRLAELQEYNEMFSQGSAAISNLVGALSAKKVQAIDKEKKAALARIDQQLKAENLSESQKNKLTAQRESVEQGYNDRMKAEKVKAAKLDKAIAATGVMLRTSMAIMSALAMIPPNIPLSFFAGATGAIQLGAVLAQPIPAYKDGGKVKGPEQTVRINEQGEEFVINAESTKTSQPLLEQINADPSFATKVVKLIENTNTQTNQNSSETVISSSEKSTYLDNTISEFERGGKVKGNEQIVRINEQGEEFVVNAESTSKNEELLQNINADPNFMMNKKVMNDKATQSNTPLLDTMNNDENYIEKKQNALDKRDYYAKRAASVPMFGGGVAYVILEKNKIHIAPEAKKVQSYVNSTAKTNTVNVSSPTRNVGFTTNTSESDIITSTVAQPNPSPTYSMPMPQNSNDALFTALIDKISTLEVKVKGTISNRAIELSNSDQAEYLNKTRLKW